jgi:hypothetical protein
MNMQDQRDDGGAAHGEHPQPGPNVSVTVDNIPKTVHRGSHLVSEFKTLVGVDAAKELEEVVDGQLTPLDDAERVVIKGGEMFFSHPRTGGSS